MAEEQQEEQQEQEQAKAVDPKQFEEVMAEVDRLREHNRKLLSEKGEAKTAAQKAAEEAAKKSGDVDALEKSWREKLENETKTRDEKIAAFQATINKMTAGSTASKMAADIAIPGSADVLMPHIERRLKTEMTDDGPIVRVLDKDGKPSAISVDDLKKEISEDKAFAPLIVGSMANGSGAPGGKGKSGEKTMKRSEFDQLDPAGKMAFVKDGGIVAD